MPPQFPAQSLFRFLAKSSLRQTIILSFLTASLGVFMMGIFVLGYWFTADLEDKLRHEIDRFTQRVEQDFRYEQRTLETEAKLIAYDKSVEKAMADRDTATLLQKLLPLRVVLAFDWVKVVDTQGQVLVDVRREWFSQAQVLDDVLSHSASRGASVTDLVAIAGQPQTLQVTVHPIKTNRVVGGLMIGRVVNDTFLQKIAAGSSKQLVVLKNQRTIATTLPELRNLNWQPPPPHHHAVRVAFQDHSYLATSFVFSGSDKSLLTMVLYPTTDLDKAKQALWLRLGGLFCAGAIVVTIVGILISQTITRPLLRLMKMAQQLAAGDLSIRASERRSDEVGQLSQSLNQMADQLAERDRCLQDQVQQLQVTLEDLQKTQFQLVQAEKMSSLGQLVAGVAHEINNPVSFIYGNISHSKEYIQDILDLIDLYRKNYPVPAPEIDQKINTIDLDFLTIDLPRLLKSMEMGSERIKDIVLSLRTFSRTDESAFKAVNIHDGIESTLVILGHRLKATAHRSAIQVIRQYGAIPQVSCYAGQLNQVFMNILSNAIDAIDAIASSNSLHQITITTEMISPPHSSSTTGPWVKVRIRDSGIGISESARSRIFDPFFTTKPIGKGTGLGLSISYQIISDGHGGQISCDSIPDQGTEFVIQIPVHPTPQTA